MSLASWYTIGSCVFKIKFYRAITALQTFHIMVSDFPTLGEGGLQLIKEFLFTAVAGGIPAIFKILGCFHRHFH